MHIPDGYLSPQTCATLAVVAIPALAVSAARVRRDLDKTRMSALGIGAAFAFLIMMFNVPVPGGTTAHAIGGTLLAALLGPWAACLAVAVALLLQALLFGDGGVLALGANVFNMAVVLPFSGWFVYKLLAARLRSRRGELVALGIGSYVGINLAALCAGIEFGIQPLLFHDAAGAPLYCPYPLGVAVPAMLIAHLVAGAVEVVFTVGIFSFVKKVSPGDVYNGKTPAAVYLLITALIVLVPLGLLASADAWGEWSADKISAVTAGGHALGFTPEGMKNAFNFGALMQDYTVRGLPDWLGYVVSALCGAAILIIISRIAASFMKGRHAGPGNP